MIVSLSMSAGGASRPCSASTASVSPAAALPPITAAARSVVGEPEIALGFDRGDGGGDALARLGQQREHVDLHGVVAQQRFVRDDLAQRQHLALVVPRDVVARAVAAIGLARFRADVHRLRRQPLTACM